MIAALRLPPGSQSSYPANTGVRVVNLMGKNHLTNQKIIAGWYTFSCRIEAVTGKNPSLIIQGQTSGKGTFRQVIPVTVKPGATLSTEFFTQYESYGYTRDVMTLTAVNCRIADVLLEKMRPSRKASVYGEGIYIDAESPVFPGELLEPVQNYLR